MLTVLALTAALTPQDGAAAQPPLERAFGMARRADRRPWADATVRLLSVPFAGCADRDFVEVTTDSKGEFHAGILVGRAYVVQACSTDGDQWLVSTRVDDAVPHLPIVLEEAAREPRVTLRLRGLDAWGIQGPVTVWCAGGRDGQEALPLRARDREGVDLPPTGTGERWLFLDAGCGLDLVRVLVPADAGAVFDFSVPAPRDVPVTVRTPEGKPVKDAVIEVRSQRATALAGRTDERGCTSVRVPAAAGEAWLPLWAQAPGHLTGRLWPTADPAGPRQIFVQPTEPPRLTFEWRPGEPLADAAVCISGVEQNIQPVGQERGRPNPSFARDGYRRTGADGVLIAPFSNEYPLSIAALLPEAGMARLRREYGAALSPVVLLYAGTPVDATPVRVDALQPVRLVLRHHDQRPAQRAHCRIGAGGNSGIGIGYVADQAGAITVLLPACNDVKVAAWHDGAGDVFELAVPARATRQVTDIVLQLPPPLRVRGRVVDAAGDPVAGAVIRLGTTLRGLRDPDWRDVEPPADTSVPHVVRRGYYYPPMAEAMFQRNVRTDAEGRFALELPGRGFPLEFRVDIAGRKSAVAWGDAEREAEDSEDVRLVVR